MAQGHLLSQTAKGLRGDFLDTPHQQDQNRRMKTNLLIIVLAVILSGCAQYRQYGDELTVKYNAQIQQWYDCRDAEQALSDSDIGLIVAALEDYKTIK